MIRRAWQAFLDAPASHLWPLALCTCAFLLAGAAWIVLQNANRLFSRWNDAGQIIVYLKPDATEEEVRFVAERLQRGPAVERVERVTSTEARSRLVRSLGDRSALLDGVEPSFFPSTVEARLAAGAWEMTRVGPWLQTLQRAPGVERVDADGEWIDRLARARSWIVSVASATSVIGLLLGASIVFGAMRLHAISRRREVEILRLCGATIHFVRGSFLLKGFLTGAVAAGISLAVLFAMFSALEAGVSHAVGFALSGQPAFLSLQQVAIAVCAAAIASAATAAAAVQPYLT